LPLPRSPLFPYTTLFRSQYEPAEAATGLFGGNSNWRGPVWFPMNYLLVESLQNFHHYYGEDFKVEFPTHSNRETDLWQVAAEISDRKSTRLNSSHRTISY